MYTHIIIQLFMRIFIECGHCIITELLLKVIIGICSCIGLLYNCIDYIQFYYR